MDLRTSARALAAGSGDEFPAHHRMPPAPLAYPVNDLPTLVGIGRSKIYEEISAGRLRVTKVGRRTVVLDEDARAWLRSLRDGKAA